MIFLSYSLNEHTPTYGNRNKFNQVKKSDIRNGDIANDTHISTTTHIGTHIDMPFHFYENGQTITDYNADFWIFNNPLIIEVTPQNLVIKDEVIDKLNLVKNTEYDIIIVKTGICNSRKEKIFWEKNYGFHESIYECILAKFPSVRVFGFDSISVSSFSNRIEGRKSHKKFLNPAHPILLLEDMDLTKIIETTNIKRIIISPLRIENSDGLPCTVFGELI